MLKICVYHELNQTKDFLHIFTISIYEINMHSLLFLLKFCLTEMKKFKRK